MGVGLKAECAVPRVSDMFPGGVGIMPRAVEYLFKTIKKRPQQKFAVDLTPLPYIPQCIGGGWRPAIKLPVYEVLQVMNLHLQVFVSFLEIYLDKLRDLAADAPSGAFSPKP